MAIQVIRGKAGWRAKDAAAQLPVGTEPPKAQGDFTDRFTVVGPVVLTEQVNSITCHPIDTVPLTHMPIIDLSHPIHAKMPVYPGDESPVCTPLASITTNGYRTTRLTMTTHTGTHIDAPAHLLQNAKTLDQFPASHFCGLARLVDCRGLPGQITKRHLEAQADLQAVEYILLHTGWSRYWQTEAYFNDFPALTPEAAAWLASRPIKGIGLDAPSIDAAGAQALGNHRLFLGQEIVIIENLTNLHGIAGQSCQLFCLPLPISAADGAPARVIACF